METKVERHSWRFPKRLSLDACSVVHHVDLHEVPRRARVYGIFIKRSMVNNPFKYEVEIRQCPDPGFIVRPVFFR